MAVTNFMAAIELGSSKITGIAGRKNADGSIQVLALASENSSDFIRKGVIYNLDKTAQSLTSIIKKLESTLKANIGKVYVGIGGQSLRTIIHTEVRHLEEETKISQELIDSLLDNNREISITDQTILEVAPQEYKVGINFLADPVGVPCESIEGRFLNIIARSSVKQNIDKCFQQAGIEIADYLISPLILANNVLTNSEKRSGCVFIDFGADTTTVSVYKNNMLRHLAVIPLGGSNITKDICSQQIEEEDAELLKRRFGCAYSEPSDTEDNPTYKIEGRCAIEARLLEDIVEARTNEILDNILNQIALSTYGDKLLAGAILTGGGINLQNMEAAFIRRTKIEKVRMARETELTLKGSNIDLKKDGSQNLILSLLASGTENCYREQESAPSSHELEAQEEQKRKAAEAAEAARKAAAEAAAEAARKAEAEAAEKARQKLAKCEMLIDSANELKHARKYKQAIERLHEALELEVADKFSQIQMLEQECKRLQDENSLINRISSIFGKILNDDK